MAEQVREYRTVVEAAVQCVASLTLPLPFSLSEENFGSDPLLVAKMAEAAVIGLQVREQLPFDKSLRHLSTCTDRSYIVDFTMLRSQGGVQTPSDYMPSPGISIGAEAKHCCAYGFSGLDGGAADISDKTLHDIYLRPWRAFIRAGGSGMMMSHNEINGVPMVRRVFRVSAMLNRCHLFVLGIFLA